MLSCLTTWHEIWSNCLCIVQMTSTVSSASRPVIQHAPRWWLFWQKMMIELFVWPHQLMCMSDTEVIAGLSHEYLSGRNVQKQMCKCTEAVRLCRTGRIYCLGCPARPGLQSFTERITKHHRVSCMIIALLLQQYDIRFMRNRIVSALGDNVCTAWLS